MKRFFVLGFTACLLSIQAVFSQTVTFECYRNDIVPFADCSICNNPADREIFNGLIVQKVVGLTTTRTKIYTPYIIKVRPNDVLIYDTRSHTATFNFSQTAQFSDTTELMEWLKVCHTPDSQSLWIVNDTLHITRGNFVDLLPYLDDTDTDTDSQSLNIINDTLYISRGNFVNLVPYLAGTDTDSQSLSFIAPDTIQISRGNKLHIPGLAGGSYYWEVNGADDAFGATTINTTGIVTFDGTNGLTAYLASGGSQTVLIDGALLQWYVAGNSGPPALIGDAGSQETVSILGATGLTTSLSANTLTITPANDLGALEGLSGTGFPVRTAAETFALRAITAGTGISITNGDGVSGNPVINNTGMINWLLDNADDVAGAETITTGETVSFSGLNGITISPISGNTIEVDGWLLRWRVVGSSGTPFTIGDGVTVEDVNFIGTGTVSTTADNTINRLTIHGTPQTLTYSGTAGGPVTLDISATSSDVTFTAGTDITFNRVGTNLTINAQEYDLSTSGSFITTLIGSGTSLQFLEGTGINLTLGGTSANATITIENTGDVSETNEVQGLSYAGAAGGPVTLDISLSANDVTFTAGSNIVFNRNSTDLTISSTANLVFTGSSNPNLTWVNDAGTDVTLVAGAGLSYTSINASSATITAADQSASNELQTLASTGTGEILTTLSGSGGSLNIKAGTGITATRSGTALDGIVTIASTVVDTDTDDQGLTYTGAAGGPVTLDIDGGGDVTITAGTNITFNRVGADLTINASGGATTDLTFTEAASPYKLNSSTGTDVTFSQAGIIVLTRVSNNLEISASEGDGDPANELQTLNSTGTGEILTTLSNSGGSLNIKAGSNITIVRTGTGLDGIATISGTDTDDQGITYTGGAGGPVTLDIADGSDVTITAGAGIVFNRVGTDLSISASDNSASNEFQTVANTGTGELLTTLSNSGGSWNIKAGTGITVTRSGTALDGIATIATTVTDTDTDDQGLTYSGGAGGPVTLDIDGGSDVTLTAGTNVTFNRVGTDLTISSASWVGGSGTVEYLPKWATSTTLNNSIVRHETTNGFIIIEQVYPNFALVLDGINYTGIRFDDEAGTGLIGYNGGIFTIGCGSCHTTITGTKVLFVAGGVVIGENEVAASAPTNGLRVEGDIVALSPVYVTDILYDKNNQAGTSQQYLSSTVDGVDWITLPDGSATNEVQTFTHTGTGEILSTLSITGGSINIKAGTGITVTRTGTALDGIATIASTVVDTDTDDQGLTYSGAAGGPVSLNIDGGSSVTITAGTNVSFNRVGTALTINTTAGGANLVFTGSVNPNLTWVNDGGTDVTLVAGAGLSYTSISTSSATITADDQSASNELQTLTSTGTGEILVTLSASGGSLNIKAGAGITVTRTGTGADGIATIASTIVDTDTDNYADAFSYTVGTGAAVIGRTGALPDLNATIRDYDFYEVGGTNSPDNIGDNKYTNGYLGLNPEAGALSHILDISGDGSATNLVQIRHGNAEAGGVEIIYGLTGYQYRMITTGGSGVDGAVYLDANNTDGRIQLLYDGAVNVFLSAAGNSVFRNALFVAESGYSDASGRDFVISPAREMFMGGLLADKDNEAGTSGQVLSSTGTNVDWITLADNNASNEIQTLTYSGAAGGPVTLDISLSASDVTLTAGTNVTFSRVGTDLTINATAGATSPGGSDTHVQFNNAGSFGGNSGFVYNGSGNVGINASPSQRFHVGGNVRITGALYDGNNEPGSATQYLSTNGSTLDWVALPDNSASNEYQTLSHNTSNNQLTITPSGNTISTLEWAFYSSTSQVSPDPSQDVLRTGRTTFGYDGISLGSSLEAEARVRIFNDSKIDNITYTTIRPSFGQRRLVLSDMVNGLWSSGTRYSVTKNGSSYTSDLMFDNNFETGVSPDASAWSIIVDLTAGAAALPSYGVVYPQGYVFISFYDVLHTHDSLRVYARYQDGTQLELTSSKADISTSGSFRVFRYNVSDKNYLTKVRVDVRNGSGGATSITEIQLYSNRANVEVKPPYFSMTETNTIWQPMTMRNSFYALSGFFDKDGQSGSSGQVLSSTGSQVDWITLPSNIVGGTGTTDFVTKWTSSTTIGNSTIRDNGITVSIGAAPDASYELFIADGNIKFGDATGEMNKLYFGDGTFVYVGENIADDRLYLRGSTLSIDINGNLGTNGYVLTSNGTTASWAATGISGTIDYVPKFTAANTIGNSKIIDKGTNGSILVGTTSDTDPTGFSGIPSAFKVVQYGMTHFFQTFTTGSPSYGGIGAFSAAGGKAYLGLSSDGVTVYAGALNSAEFQLVAGNSIWVTIETDGKTGIATSGATQRLHVADPDGGGAATGNIRVEGAYYDSQNDPGSGFEVLSTSTSGSKTDWAMGTWTMTLQSGYDPSTLPDATNMVLGYSDWGDQGYSINTISGYEKVYAPHAGTIYKVACSCAHDNAASNEGWTWYIRKNDTTDYTIATSTSTASSKTFISGTLGITMLTTDYYTIKMVNPTWTTNPIGIAVHCTIFFFST